jgi:hypothetical protein
MEGSRVITPRGKLRTVETRGYGLVYGLGTNLGTSGKKPEGAVKMYDGNQTWSPTFLNQSLYKQLNTTIFSLKQKTSFLIHCIMTFVFVTKTKSKVT